MEHKWNEEVQKLSHVALVVTVAAFSLVLILLNRLLGWEFWTIPVILAGCAICVVMHTARLSSENSRLAVYAIVLLLELFYYSVNVESIYDSTPAVVILLVLFAMTGRKTLIYSGIAVGYFGMIVHLFLFESSGQGMDLARVVQIVWHFALVLIAGLAVERLLDAWRRAERAHLDAIDAVEEENERINTFLVNVSHEVRTPVNAVVGLSSVLLKRVADETVKKDLRSVLDAGRRVAEQIGDILDFTELDMGKLSVSRESYMVASLVNDVVAEHPARSLNGCELTFNVEAETPAALIGDGTKIKKIIHHLITNALKFSQKGGVYVRIHANERDYGVNLCIEVTDTGIGMTEEELEHACDSFYQTSSGRTRTTGGLGLGLTIVRGMVREMNGFVTMESESGVGTTVSVSIPQGVADPARCMSVENREKLCIAGFFRFEKYEVPRVRDFYSRLITETARGLGVSVHLANSTEDLEALHRAYGLTHIFAGEEEFLSAMERLEPLADEISVTVVAGEDFHAIPGTAVKILRKPFCAFSVAAILNTGSAEEQAEAWDETRRMSTPGLETLVVDDEPMNLLVAEGLFGEYGMRVSTARSGMEAVELCKTRHFDLIFMDHMMPEMDGVEAMKRIRADIGKSGRETVFVALTANAVSGAREMFLSEGFDGFVAKPVETSELERVLKRVLPKKAIVYEDAAAKPRRNTPRPGNTGRAVDAGRYDRLERAGVRTAKGLEYCRGDGDFYAMLLGEYARHTAEKTEQMEAFYATKDWKNYAILAHALKSGAQMIGAEELSSLARTLETAAKRGDASTITRWHEKLLGRAATVAEAVLAGTPAAEASGEDVLEFAPDDGDDVMEFEPEEG